LGVYNYLLTTKTIRVKTDEGRETINLMCYVSKQSSWETPAWETALLSRMEYVWAQREYPKYVTGDDTGPGWSVYEEIRSASFTDDYPSTRIFAGYLRAGSGKMLHFEKWKRVRVAVEAKRGDDGHYAAQREVQDKLRESGLMGGEWMTSRFTDREGKVFI